MSPSLSVVIPTHRRPALLASTLEAFLPQVAPHRIPICIAYTEDAGETLAVIDAFRERYPHVRVITDPSATNIDRKMVAAVRLAQTSHVWLFGDDDVPVAGAIDRIQALLASRDWGVIVLNAESWDEQLERRVEARRIRVTADREYPPGHHEEFLRDTVRYATFLGGLVFRKALWDAVPPDPFYDTDYLHVSILYRSIVRQPAYLVADPQLRIRLGRTTWSHRYFQVELVHWPAAIWGLPAEEYAEEAKVSITQRRPARSVRRLLATRAYGAYRLAEFRQYVATDRQLGLWRRVLLASPLLVPVPLASMLLRMFRRVEQVFGDPNVELTRFRLRG
jgi:glycosyltransferase involved in cell wall biosynthesis